MSSAAPTGYDAVILSLPSTAFFRSRSSVCSLSLIVAWSTLASANWASAVEVWTSLYPPFPRNRDENATASRTTSTTQNHTERKIFLRSIPRPGGRSGPACPSTLLIVRGRHRQTRAGYPGARRSVVGLDGTPERLEDPCTKPGEALNSPGWRRGAAEQLSAAGARHLAVVCPGGAGPAGSPTTGAAEQLSAA